MVLICNDFYANWNCILNYWLAPTVMKYFWEHVELFCPRVKLTYNEIPNPSFRIARVSLTGVAKLRAHGRHGSLLTSRIPISLRARFGEKHTLVLIAYILLWVFVCGKCFHHQIEDCEFRSKETVDIVLRHECSLFLFLLE